MLTRLKVAAALMVLAERRAIEPDDWALAGEVLAVSDATREGVVRAAEDQRHRQVRGRAAETVEREEYIGQDKLAQAKRRVLRRLDKLRGDASIPHSELRRALTSNVRDEFDPAITELIDEKRVIKVELDRGYGYVRATPATLAPLQESAGEAGVAGVAGVARIPTDPSWVNGAQPAPVTESSTARATALGRRHEARASKLTPAQRARVAKLARQAASSKERGE